MKIPYCEMYDHCRKTIPGFQWKERNTLGVMDEMRCPLSHATTLYEEMREAIEEYCEDHNLDWDALWKASSGDLIEDVFWEGDSADLSNI